MEYVANQDSGTDLATLQSQESEEFGNSNGKLKIGIHKNPMGNSINSLWETLYRNS